MSFVVVGSYLGAAAEQHVLSAKLCADCFRLINQYDKCQKERARVGERWREKGVLPLIYAVKLNFRMWHQKNSADLNPSICA